MRLSLRAWEPVFALLREALGPAVLHALFGDDWRVAQQRTVEAACADAGMHVLVVTEPSGVAGSAALTLYPENGEGSPQMGRDRRAWHEP